MRERSGGRGRFRKLLAAVEACCVRRALRRAPHGAPGTGACVWPTHGASGESSRSAADKRASPKRKAWSVRRGSGCAYRASPACVGIRPKPIARGTAGDEPVPAEDNSGAFLFSAPDRGDRQVSGVPRRPHFEGANWASPKRAGTASLAPKVTMIRRGEKPRAVTMAAAD